VGRTLRALGLTLGLLLALVSGALASSVHLKGGRNAKPTFTDTGLTLTAAGELAGLGNGDVVLTLSAQAQATATCTTPSGATQPPPIPGAPDCPNPRWTEAITDLAFTSAVITVTQGGATVLTITCTVSPPTTNGGVPPRSVTCQAG